MARTAKKQYLNSDNAQSVANRGLNAAFSQSHSPLRRGDDGKWRETGSYTQSRLGRMSTNGRTAGGSTWTFTDKDNGRQSGRSTIATRRQRYYDVRVGLGLAGG